MSLSRCAFVLFDGSHLRYLGWVLSDPNSPTRVEVLHQLARLFKDKDKLAGLKTFTERFRPRIVEIATRDAENNVRAAAVDLLDILREAGFLEPDDIDSVGKLIFDADAKVRKAVVGFFAENVNAAYEAIVEDMGGQEALDEALGSPDDEDEEFQNILVGVSNIVLKIAQLSKASDATVLDHIVAPANSRSKSKKAAMDSPPITSVLQILDRGVPSDDLDEETNEAEDTLVRHAMSLLLTYFVWKCHECQVHIEEGTSMPDDDLTLLVERRDTCITSLMTILTQRKGADDVRLDAANLLLDIYNMFRTLQTKKANLTQTRTPKKPQSRASRSDETSDDWESLAQTIDTPTIKLILQILTAAENNLAKQANKRLEEPDIDDDPIDPDSEPDSDAEDAQERTSEDKQVKTLLAEERLCVFGGRLVHAYLAGSLGKEGGEVVRKRMERNRGKLTATWKEVVGHLDVNKFVKKQRHAAGKPAAKPGKSKEIVIESDDEEEGEGPGDDVEVERGGEGEGEGEDEEMGDADEQVNGAEAAAGTEEQVPDNHADDEESILGD